MDAILEGRDYVPLLTTTQSKACGESRCQQQQGRLLVSIAKALYNEKLDRDAARTALEDLQTHDAPVTECLDDALRGRQRHIYKPLLENLKVEGEDMVGLLWSVVACCDPNGDDNDAIDGMIQCLVDNGLYLNGHCTDIKPLEKSLGDGNMVAVGALLRAGVNLNLYWDELCIHACGFKCGKMVKLLIEHGYDVNLDSEMEGTALHWVAFQSVLKDDTRILEMFMKAGAKERVVNGGLTPSQSIKEEVDELIADGDPPVAGALERTLHVLATVRSGDKETPRVELKKENKRLEKEVKQLKDENNRLKEEAVRQ